MEIDAISQKNSALGQGMDVKQMTNNAVREHMERTAGAAGGASAASQASQIAQIAPQRDVAAISEEAVQQINTTEEGNFNVDTMLSKLKEYIDGKLNTDNDSQNNPNMPNLNENDGKANQAQAQQAQNGGKQTVIEVDFTPSVGANTIVSPGQELGRVSVSRKENETGEVAASQGAAQANNQNQVTSLGNQGGQSSQGVSGVGVNGADKAQGPKAPLDMPQNAVNNAEDPQATTEKVILSPAAQQAMQAGTMGGGLNQLLQAGQTGKLGQQGQSAPTVPEDGTVIKAKGWEQTVWVHPGGDVSNTQGTVAATREIDSESAGLMADSTGKDAKAVAEDFDKKSKMNPVDQKSQTMATEAEKLKNPTETNKQ